MRKGLSLIKSVVALTVSVDLWVPFDELSERDAELAVNSRTVIT